MRKFQMVVGAAALAGALSGSTPASATSTVAVNGTCSNMTDGMASSCHFSGNIGTGTGGAESYHNTESAYDTWASSHNPVYPANLTLTPLADFSGAGSNAGITVTGGNGSTGGTFSFGSGISISYYAVKAGNDFVLYEFTGSPGTYNWSTAGLTNQKGNLLGLSHIVFFGSVGGVPEPATWAMMLLGIGMIGGAVRRRQGKQNLALA